MAKLPSKRKLLREDLKEAPAWIDKILGFVNPFFEDVYFSLNKNITLRENIDCDVREITIETTSTYSNNIPNVVPIQGEIDALTTRVSTNESDILEIEPQIDALTTGVSTNESDILAIESQLPPPISAITGLGDLIKIGTFDSTTDNAQTFNFSVAFSSGSDSDIQVVVTRTKAGASYAFSVTAATKTGFTVDRNNDVSGTQTFRYIAINGSYL